MLTRELSEDSHKVIGQFAYEMLRLNVIQVSKLRFRSGSHPLLFNISRRTHSLRQDWVSDRYNGGSFKSQILYTIQVHEIPTAGHVTITLAHIAAVTVVIVHDEPSRQTGIIHTMAFEA